MDEIYTSVWLDTHCEDEGSSEASFWAPAVSFFESVKKTFDSLFTSNETAVEKEAEEEEVEDLQDDEGLTIKETVGKYELLDVVSARDGSITRKAMCMRTGESKFIKMHVGVSERTDEIAEILRSCQDSPYVIRMDTYLKTKINSFFVFEHPNSVRDIYDFIVNEKPNKQAAKKIFKQIALAIQHLHKNKVAHRDLKCENVLVIGEELDVRLIDFEFSVRLTEERLFNFPGTIDYAPPEMIQRMAHCGRKADVWSLGVILHALLTHGLPFDNEQQILKMPVPYNPNIPQDARNLLDRMLKKNPYLRASIDEVVDHKWLE